MQSCDRVGGQLRGNKECPFSGVAKSTSQIAAVLAMTLKYQFLGTYTTMLISQIIAPELLIIQHRFFLLDDTGSHGPMWIT